MNANRGFLRPLASQFASYAVLALSAFWTGLRRFYIYKFPLDKDISDKCVESQDITFELLTNENMGLLEAWLTPFALWQVKRTLEEGGEGIIAIANGEAAGYNMASVNCMSWSNYQFIGPLAENESFLHRGVTHPRYRRRGIMTCSLVKQIEHFQQKYGPEAMPNACGANHPRNFPQNRVVERLGFIRTHFLVYTRLFSICFVRLFWELDAEGNRHGPGKLEVNFWLPEFLRDTQRKQSENGVLQRPGHAKQSGTRARYDTET